MHAWLWKALHVMKQKPRVCILTAMYNRPLVSELFALSLQRVIKDQSKNYSITSMAAVTGAESKDVCRRYSIPYVDVPNNPVGRKWNAGLKEALKDDWDYVLIMGDDDIMSSELLDHYMRYVRDGYNYFGVDSLYFYSPKQQRAVHFTYQYNTPKLIGCGIMHSRESVLNTAWKVRISAKEDLSHGAVHIPANAERYIPEYQAKHIQQLGYLRIISEPVFEFWQDSLNRSLDKNKDFNLVFNGWFPYVVSTGKPLITDVKTKQNIWTFDHYAQNTPAARVEDAISFFSAEEKEFIKCNLMQ